MNSCKRLFSVTLIGLLAASASMFGGNTGKIVGKVTDAQSGEGLISVNILVVGTTRGAVTDVDGKYTIIGIPIGSYTVRASQVGYQQVEISDVKIGADETTPLNFKLLSTAVEMKGVTVTADQQLVNNLSTSSTQTVSEKTIENIPNVKSVEDVLRLQAGVVKQGNNTFLRGGRSNEVQYLVDGVPTNNILSNDGPLTTAGDNTELAKVYAGIQSGTVGGGSTSLSVSANAIQSVSVQTSGFDADYGNAQSGIVNIVTKSGSDRYAASTLFRTDRVSSSNQNESYSSFSLGGPEPLSKYVLPGLGVNIPGQLTFFVNADIDRADGSNTFAHNDYYHPLERRVELNGFLGGILNGMGYRYNDEQKNNFTFDSKISYNVSGSDQMFYKYSASLKSAHDFNNTWKYRADSSLLKAALSIQHVYSWTHFLGQNSFLRMNLGEVEIHSGNDVAGTKPTDYSTAWRYRDPNDDGFNDLGSEQTWFNELARIWSARIDFNSQVHPLHLLKAGFEVYYEEINSTTIVDPTVPQQVNGVLTSPPFPFPDFQQGDYPGYGVFRSTINNYPNRGGLYLQDNIEFSGLNLHVGLRYDYFDIGRQVYYPDVIEKWGGTLNPPGLPIGAERIDTSWVTDLGYNDVNDSTGHKISSTPKGLDDWTRFKYFFAHGWLSPRLSIGYPVTDRIVFYFNYGHFLQFPDRENYFQNPTITTTGTSLGNPSLKPQRTVAYEAGFEDQFTDDMAFAVHAFYKDVFDYPQTFTREGYKYLRNFDYASTRGFEFTFNQALTGNLSTSASYSYQIAKGRSSNSLASLFQPLLPRESRLDFDQNHTANLLVSYRVSPKEPGKFFGLPFINNYGISFTWNFGSGFPYTPVYGRANARTLYLNNNETKPFTSTVNLSMYKGFFMMDHLNLLVTLDVTNLFNRRNVVAVNYQDNPALPSGDPPRYGDYDPSTGEILPWRQADGRLNPANFQDMRQVILGVKLNWD